MARSRSQGKIDRGRTTGAVLRSRFGAVPWKKLAVALLGICLAGGLGAVAWPPVARYRTARQFERAQQLAASGQDDAGAAALRALLERDPSHRKARLALARLELKRGHLERAFLEFETYTELAPLDPEGWLGLTDVRQRAGQKEEAETVLGRAIDLARDREDLRRRRAELRYLIGRLHAARVDAEAAVSGDPRDVAAWIVLCRTTAAAGGKQAAAQAVRKAIAAAGQDPRLLELSREPPPAASVPQPPARQRPTERAENWPGDLGVTIRDFSTETRQRNWAAAIRIARSARDRYPGTMIGPWLEGVAAQGEGNLLLAEEALLAALAVAPRSHRAVSNLIAVWARQNGPEYTLERLLALVERDPGFTYPLPIAAQASLEAARPSQAEATIRRLLVNPDAPSAYRAVADFYLRVDRAGDAMAVAAQGLSRFPSDAELHALRGRAALLIGDREAAIRAYQAAVAAELDDLTAAAQLARLLAKNRADARSRERAMELVRDLQLDQASDPEVMAAMGVVILTAGGDARGALPWLEAAREQLPEDPGIRFHLALAWARAGDKEAARRELQEALRSGRTFDEEPEARRLARELGI